MSADDTARVDIPSVFLLQPDGELLWSYAVENVIQVHLLGEAPSEMDVLSGFTNCCLVAYTYGDGEREAGKDCSPATPLPVP